MLCLFTTKLFTMAIYVVNRESERLSTSVMSTLVMGKSYPMVVTSQGAYTVRQMLDQSLTSAWPNVIKLFTFVFYDLRMFVIS